MFFLLDLMGDLLWAVTVGMSDLLSPFIVLFDIDADAFWCFESLLKRVVRILPACLFQLFVLLSLVSDVHVAEVYLQT